MCKHNLIIKNNFWRLLYEEVVLSVVGSCNICRWMHC